MIESNGGEMIGPYDEKDLPSWAVKANEAIKKSVKAAIEEHWRAGRPVYVWRDEQVMALFKDGTCVPAAEVKKRREIDAGSENQ